jgi:hypothetical protein
MENISDNTGMKYVKTLKQIIDPAWHGFTYYGQNPGTSVRNFNIAVLPDDEFNRINTIQNRQRYNQVVETGVPGFIARKN